MIIYLSWIIVATHLIGRILLARKVWFAPIYCASQELIWIALFLLTQGTWPLLLLCLGDMTIYILAIRKWRMER